MATHLQQIPRESSIQLITPIESSETLQHSNKNIESRTLKDEIINSILPPRRRETEGHFHLQYAHSNPASRENVANP